MSVHTSRSAHSRACKRQHYKDPNLSTKQSDAMKAWWAVPANREKAVIRATKQWYERTDAQIMDMNLKSHLGKALKKWKKDGKI